MAHRHVTGGFWRHGAVWLSVFLALCGCEKPAPAVGAAKASGDAMVTRGVVVSVRAASGHGSPVRGAILGAIGAASPDPRALPRRGEVAEIIVREEDGQAVSLMQANTENFRPGENVLLTRGANARIARPGT